MRINKIPPQRQKVFYASVGLAIGLALVVGFFSFKQTWSKISFSSGVFSKMTEVKNEVKDIGSGLKNDLQGTVGETIPEVKDVAEAVVDAAEQRKQATEVVGNIMKENLENQYGENQENPQTPSE